MKGPKIDRLIKQLTVFIILSVLLIPVILSGSAVTVESETYWLIETIEGEGGLIAPGNVPHYTSIALDSSRRPHVAYRVLTYTPVTDPYVLRYSSRTGAGDTWEHALPDPTQGQIIESSIAVDSLNHPHIAYHQAGVLDLRYATDNGTGWLATTPDDINTTGRHPSIAIDSSNRPWIAYYDEAANQINCIYNDGTWKYYSQISNDTLGISYGRSLALDSSNNPHIVYNKWVDDSRYQLIYYNGSTSEVVDGATGGSYGHYASIAIDSNNRPHISYSDETGGITQLKYAYYNGTSWTKETVDGAPTWTVGTYNCIAVDSGNHPHISYYDHVNGNLKYAYNDGTGWTCLLVDSAGDVGSSSSIAVDGSGHPHISYDDITNRAIKYATTIYPSVTTNAATGIDTSSATLNMSYDFKNYSEGWVSFSYRKTGNTTWTWTNWQARSGSGSYGEAVAGLSSNTEYEFRAMLRYETITTIAGSTLTFTTDAVVPTVTTSAATGIGTSSATLNMSYNFNDYSPGQVQFAYKKTSDSTWTYTSWVDKSGSGTHLENLSSLSPYTYYQFKARLKYNSTEIEGSTLQFNTIPTVTTNNATGVAATSAQLNMSFSIGNGSYVEVQFAYKKTSDSTWTYTDWEGRLGGVTGSTWDEVVYGLSSNTEYEFKARLKYNVSLPGEAEIEGSTLTFTTAKAVPTVTTMPATDNTTSSAVLNMSFNFKDYSPGQVQFAYKKTSDSTWTFTSWVDKAASDNYSESVSGLSIDTEYQFKARLKYDSTEIEGSTLTFLTSMTAPAVITDSAGGIDTASATLNMSFNFNDYTSGQVQFAYKKAADSTWTFTSWENKSGADSYVESVSGLESNTEYQFKARLKYDTTEIEGSELSFTTLRIDAASVATATGTGNANFAASDGSITNLTAVATTPCGSMPGTTFPHGFFSYNITGITNGSTVTITITLPSSIPSSCCYWKCVNGLWINVTSLVGDNDGDNILTLTITDGGLGDADGQANGTISDPGGPGYAIASAATATITTPPAKPFADSSSSSQMQYSMPARISVKYLNVQPAQARINQPVTVYANMTNGGDEPGKYTATLKINGQVAEIKTGNVGAHAAAPISFIITRNQPGTYTVDINGQVSSFTITGTQNRQNARGTVILVMIICIIGILLVGALIVRRYRSQQ